MLNKLKALKKPWKFSSYIVGNYFIFSFSLILSIILGFALISFLLIRLGADSFYYNDIYDMQDDILAGNYDKVDVDFLNEEKGWMVLKNFEGQILHTFYSSDIDEDFVEQATLAGNYDEQDFYLSHESGLTYTIVIPERAYFTKQENYIVGNTRLIMTSFYVTLVVLYILAIYLISKFLGKRVSKPIDKLKELINDYSERKEVIPDASSNIAEFADLFKVFNKMTIDLKASEDERKRLENSKLELLASLSHDIKTPLASVQGYAQAIRGGYVDENKLNKALEVIDIKSNEVIDMVNLLHEYIKIEHPSYQLHLVEVNLGEIVREWLAEAYDEISSKGYDLQVDIPSDYMPVRIDLLHFKRAFMNLVYNAVYHNTPGIMIKVSIHIDDAYHIYVEDTGKGINREDSENLMKPFKKGDTSRNSKGSGLGLAISSQILMKHQGLLTIDQPNKPFKSRLNISLPKKTV